MRRHLANMPALLAFEAAARHVSFSRAAEELALTEGAISRQISRLEDFLGVNLFLRIGNRVRLSRHGTSYAEQISEILSHLERETMRLMALPDQGGALEIAVISTFANRWLIPRLERFRQRSPDITVNLSERNDPFILPDSGFDAAIHFDHGAWVGMNRHPLFREPFVPVCAPRLLDDNAPDPGILDALPLLHRTSTPESWRHYAIEFGFPIANPMKGARYDRFSMLIEAALAGLGVALVPQLYVAEDIANGRLLAPWPLGRSSGKSFVLVMPPEKRDNALLCTFADWLMQEAAR